MSYTKTQWVNNTTPINDTNLNKIEQGIYDNSLVVDAVTNTINPTDTETYKTAELTEGQITDVIGVNDIVIKGQTSQDGEPTPNSPVDVNVVSGSNVIDIQNSDTNLAKEPVLINYNVNNDGLGTSNGFAVSEKIYVNNNTKFYYGLIKSFSNVSDSILRIGFFDENNNFLSRILATDISANQLRSVTIPNNTKYLMIGANNGNTDGFWREINKVYYGFSSTIVPHQGKELPLDLPVENLFSEFAFTDKTANGLTVKRNDDNTLLIKGTSTATVNNWIDNLNISLKAGTYTFSTNYNLSGAITISLKDNNSQNLVQFNTGKSASFTISETKTFNQMLIQVASGVTINNNFSFQLEQGSKTNAYTPYGTDPIELCKIGDYQDYFYKSGSKWYLHKEVGKYTLDGTNNAIIGKSGTTNNNLFISSVISDILMPTNNNESINVYCSHFIGGKSANYLFLNNTLGIAVRTTKDLSIGVTLENTNNTIALINTWLASNNVITYYPLATATDTEITGTLKEQLEATYNAPLYEQTNITQTNNDLPMVLDITACKDNINGIKAFIRK